VDASEKSFVAIGILVFDFELFISALCELGIDFKKVKLSYTS